MNAKQDQRPMTVATVEMTSAAAMIHLEAGDLLVLRRGMLADGDLEEVAGIMVGHQEMWSGRRASDLQAAYEAGRRAGADAPPPSDEVLRDLSGLFGFTLMADGPERAPQR